MSVLDRIMKHVTYEPNTGCWLWTAGDNGRGYGRVKIDRAQHQAHRAVYSIVVGSIPDGMELDHTCRVKCCVNPKHLDPVTHRENVKRGTAGATTAQRQRSKTKCPFGHEYTAANIVPRKNGTRRCRTCHNRQQREAKHERKNSQTAQPSRSGSACRAGRV